MPDGINFEQDIFNRQINELDLKKVKDRHNYIQLKLFFRFKSNVYFVFVIFI